MKPNTVTLSDGDDVKFTPAEGIVAYAISRVEAKRVNREHDSAALSEWHRWATAWLSGDEVARIPAACTDAANAIRREMIIGPVLASISWAAKEAYWQTRGHPSVGWHVLAHVAAAMADCDESMPNTIGNALMPARLSKGADDVAAAPRVRADTGEPVAFDVLDGSGKAFLLSRNRGDCESAIKNHEQTAARGGRPAFRGPFTIRPLYASSSPAPEREADTERLDWLEVSGCLELDTFVAGQRKGRTLYIGGTDGEKISEGSTYRECIDKAMAFPTLSEAIDAARALSEKPAPQEEK